MNVVRGPFPALHAIALLALIPNCKGCGADVPGPGATAVHASASVDAASSAAPVTSSGQNEDGGLPPSIPNAPLAVNTIRPAMRACFAKMIRREPGTVGGSVTLAIEVGVDGKVTAVTPTIREGFDDACIACMVDGAKTAHFDAPLDHHPATVIVPLQFTAAQQKGLFSATPSAAVSAPPR